MERKEKPVCCGPSRLQLAVKGVFPLAVPRAYRGPLGHSPTGEVAHIQGIPFQPMSTFDMKEASGHIADDDGGSCGTPGTVLLPGYHRKSPALRS